MADSLVLVDASVSRADGQKMTSELVALVLKATDSLAVDFRYADMQEMQDISHQVEPFI